MEVLWRFFALAFGISWSLWALALLHTLGGTNVPAGQVLPYAGVFGPCIAAMLCAGVEGRAAVGRLLRGILAARQNWIWYAVALFLMPACMTLAKVLSGRPMMDSSTPPVPMQPVVLVMVFAGTFLAAGFCSRFLRSQLRRIGLAHPLGRDPLRSSDTRNHRSGRASQRLQPAEAAPHVARRRVQIHSHRRQYVGGDSVSLPTSCDESASASVKVCRSPPGHRTLPHGTTPRPTS